MIDQFRIRKKFPKTFNGCKRRNISKITAIRSTQYLNEFVFNRSNNNFKVNPVQMHIRFNEFNKAILLRKLNLYLEY